MKFKICLWCLSQIPNSTPHRRMFLLEQFLQGVLDPDLDFCNRAAGAEGVVVGWKRGRFCFCCISFVTKKHQLDQSPTQKHTFIKQDQVCEIISVLSTCVASAAPEGNRHSALIASNIQLISMMCNSFHLVFCEKSYIAAGRMAMHSKRWRARLSKKKRMQTGKASHCSALVCIPAIRQSRRECKNFQVRGPCVILHTVCS